MAKWMKRLTICSLLLTVVMFIYYQNQPMNWLLSATITFAIISYHLGMRLIVGHVYDRIMHNQADYTKRWYQILPWERRLYDAIKVKKWKGNMPTYQPNLFLPRVHTWHEIAQAMCQAELVHETIIVFSFLPILAAKYVGAFPVFLLTSLGAALFDALFVIMQRYNRPRVVQLALREQQHTKGGTI